MRVGTCLVGVLLSIPGAVWAQSEDAAAPKVVTVEVMGGWGVQLGETEYLPDGAPTDFQHPFVSGWSAGATAGWLFARDLALIATYEYRTASSVEGSVTGVIDRVQGSVMYHTAVLGLRLYRDLGPGRLRADMGVGVAFPFETETEYDWGDGLAPAGISGSGTRTDEYAIGFGVAGQVGYEVDVGGPVFIGLGIELRAFQSNNNDEQTRLDNVVTDLTAVPPVAVDATIDYGDGQAQPSTYAVADLGFRLAVGARF